jgi:hypothetical protein
VDLGPFGGLGRPTTPAEADDEEDERRLDGDEGDGADRDNRPVELADRLPAVGLRSGRPETPWRRARRAGKGEDGEDERKRGERSPAHRRSPV